MVVLSVTVGLHYDPSQNAINCALAVKDTRNFRV